MSQSTLRASRRTATSSAPKPSALFAHDAEIALTASILLAPDLLSDVASICTTEDIQDPSCCVIFSAATMLDERGQTVTVNSVVEFLDNRAGRLAHDVVDAIVEAVPTGVHAERYATLVHEAASRRRIQATLRDIATANRDGVALATIRNDIRDLIDSEVWA